MNVLTSALKWLPLLALLFAGALRAETFTGSIDSSDYVTRTHAFTLAADGAWSFDLATTGDLSLWNRGLKVLAADGTLIHHYLYIADGDSRGPLPLAAGSYSLVIEGVQSGSYTVTSRFTAQSMPADDEPNDVVGSARGTTLDAGLNGRLGYRASADGSGDPVDWWRLSLAEDGALSFTVSMDETITFWNQFLEVYDADGVTLLRTYRYVGNDEIPATRGPIALRAGDYHVKVATTDSTSYYGGYAVATRSVSSAFANDVGANDQSSAATDFSLGGSITGHLGYQGGGAGSDADPVDWWRFSVSEEREVTFTIERESELSLWNYGVTLFKADATTRVVQYNYFDDASKTFDPVSLDPGTYYLKVQGSGYGGYRISSTGGVAAPACSGTLVVSNAAGDTFVNHQPLTVGETMQLTASGISCTSGSPDYQWSTSGFLGSESGPSGEVVSVTQDGLVTAVAEGYGFVTVTESNTGNWLDSTFTVSAAAAVCDGTNLEACTTQNACTGAGGYWNFDWCGAAPQSDPSHYPTYCEQGYTQYCSSGGECSADDPAACTDAYHCQQYGGSWVDGLCEAADTPTDGSDGGESISDWIPRSDVAYQSAATRLQQTDGYRLNGGAWTNGRPDASGESDGNGVQSRAEYDFVGRTAYAAFMVHGAGSYAAWWVKPWYLPMHHMNSHHSWADGTVIPDDTWIYATYEIGRQGQWSVVLASGDYQHLGGSVLHRESGTLTDEQLGQLAASPFLVTFTDNYGGVDAYMVVREVMVAGAADGATDAGGGCRATVSLQGELRIPCVQVGDAIYDPRLMLVDAPDIRFELMPTFGLSTVADAASDACLARYDTFHHRVHLPCVDVDLASAGGLAVWAELEPIGNGPGGNPVFRVADFGAIQ